MGFLTGLFGGETNIWTILLALIIVIALIFFGVWILKLIFKASVTIAGGRKRRLAMVDTLAIDNKRNIILIRRDNVEHLIMVSNTGELLIEGSIPTNSGNSELGVPKSPPIERKIPSLGAKKPAISAGGVAAGGVAAGAVAAKAEGKHNNNTSAKPQNTLAQKHVADRLGLSRLLRRNNEPNSQDPKLQDPELQDPKSVETAPILASAQSPNPQKNTAAVAPISDASASASAQTIISAALGSTPSDAKTSKKTAPVFATNTVTPLRTTGILKPISEMARSNSDISPPKNGAESDPDIDSPLENKSVEIEPVGDIAGKVDGNAAEKSETNETKSTPEDEPKSTETPKKPATKAKDLQITEEVTSNEQDNIKAISPDSAKNEVQQIDAKAMESIEEGTNSGDDGAKSSKKASDSGSAKDPKSSEKTN